MNALGITVTTMKTGLTTVTRFVNPVAEADTFGVVLQTLSVEIARIPEPSGTGTIARRPTPPKIAAAGSVSLSSVEAYTV